MAANAITYGGIDLGGTKIQAVVVTHRYEVVGEARRATPTSGGPADVVAEMTQAMLEAASEAGVETPDIIGVGVGAPGAAEFETGTLLQAPNLPGWDDPYPLGPALSERLGAPVFLAMTWGWQSTPSSSSGPASRFARSSASGGAPESAAASSSTGSAGAVAGRPES
jgi:predicted NBD/HSP70 family sugar kinase